MDKDEKYLGDIGFVYGNHSVSSFAGETEHTVKALGLKKDSTGGYLPTGTKNNFKENFTKIGDFFDKKDVL